MWWSTDGQQHGMWYDANTGYPAAYPGSGCGSKGRGSRSGPGGSGGTCRKGKVQPASGKGQGGSGGRGSGTGKAKGKQKSKEAEYAWKYEKCMPIYGLADYPKELQTRKSYERMGQRQKQAAEQAARGVPAERRSDVTDKRNAARTIALYAAAAAEAEEAAATSTAPSPAAAARDSGAAASSAVPHDAGVASLGNSTASEELAGARPQRRTRARSCSTGRNKIDPTAAAVPTPRRHSCSGSRRTLDLPEIQAQDSGNDGRNASPAAPGVRLSTASSAVSALTSPPDANNRSTRDLLEVRPPASEDGGRNASAASTDIRLSTGSVQPKALPQTHAWRRLENGRTPEHVMLAQLGFNPSHVAPKGRRHYIDAYAYDEGYMWSPEHYTTAVSFQESQEDMYDQDVHASKCFLPPPWT